MAVAQIYVHSPAWPFSRLCQLTTADDVNRSFEHLAPGRAEVKIARNDPNLSRDNVWYGNILVITSPSAPPWAGPISVLSESDREGTISIEAQEMSAVLGVRGTPQGESWDKAASGVVFRAVLDRINARGHTGLFRPSEIEPGPLIEGLAVGGQTADQALQELFSRTGYEWWVELVVSPARLQWTINWGADQGLDRSKEVELIQGRHFTELERVLDVSNVRQSVTAIGGGWGTVASRTSVTKTGATAPGSVDLGAVALQYTDQALIEALDVPPALRSETVLIYPGSRDQNQLAQVAQQALERPLGAAEKFNVSVNELVSWTAFGVGDYITITKGSGGLGALRRKARIVGMQPDEELGECDLILEVPLR